VGIGLPEASVEVPIRFCFRKKRPIAPFLAVGSKASLVGCVCSNRRRVERVRGRRTQLTLDEDVAKVFGVVKQRGRAIPITVGREGVFVFSCLLER